MKKTNPFKVTATNPADQAYAKAANFFIQGMSADLETAELRMLGDLMDVIYDVDEDGIEEIKAEPFVLLNPIEELLMDQEVKMLNFAKNYGGGIGKMLVMDSISAGLTKK